ncbi:GNAT family N-acetyltransferase [Gluconacetobacter sp.]|uniref:GNAT family N-acetyltransferase n=1 Tax=Gluconacetobacter sp. TaxID=1935994 RepID=UPI0039E7E77A
MFARLEPATIRRALILAGLPIQVTKGDERTQPAEYVEVSGIYTHPDRRGRGSAGFFMREVATRILARGTIPFLHCHTTNSGAIALYRPLGFTPFQTVTAAIFSAT